MAETIAWYVTAHGYGHAVRSSQVIASLLTRSRAIVRVRTGAPAWLFPRDDRVSVEPVDGDVGLVQASGIDLDLGATLERLEAFDASWEERVRAEARWLAEVGARVVVGDVPPLAFAAAARAGVPSVAVANFSWDWIYASYAPAEPAFRRHAERAAAAYALAGECLRLPFHGPMAAFPVVRDVPLVARRSRRSRPEARSALGLPLESPLVLLSFGGFGLASIDVEPLGRMTGVEFVTTERHPRAPRNLRWMDPRDVDYADLLRACDAVVTKPGYGITSESLVNEVRVLYTARGEFPEAAILVEALEMFGTAAFLSPQTLLTGDFAAPLRTLLERPVCPLPLAYDGADVTAAAICEKLSNGEAR